MICFIIGRDPADEVDQTAFSIADIISPGIIIISQGWGYGNAAPLTDRCEKTS